MASDVRFDAHVSLAQATANRLSGSTAPMSLSWTTVTVDIQEAMVSGPYNFADGDITNIGNTDPGADDLQGTNIDNGEIRALFDPPKVADPSDVALGDALTASGDFSDAPEDTSTILYEDGSVDFRWGVVLVSVFINVTFI